MLTQEQALEKTIFGAGQTLLRPQDVDISPQDIYNRFFYPAVKEYERWRPVIVKLESVLIVNAEWKIPDDCIKIISIRPINLMRAWGTPAPYVRIPSHQWWVTPDGILKCPSGQWEIEYQRRFTWGNEVKDEIVLNAIGLQGTQRFDLPAEILPSTLRLNYGGSAPASDLEGVITGDGITEGTIDYIHSKISVNFTEPTQDIVTASYTTKFKYVNELDMGEEMFLDLFAARFLTGYANLKMQMNLENLPVNINLDDIMSYAREKETNYRTRLETIQKWFAW